MGASQAVYIKSGDQPRAFQWANPAVNYTTANATSNSLYKESVYSCFQASITSTTPGALTGTFNFYVSMDDNTGRGWILGGTNAPGFIATTTAASATVNAPAGGIFTQALVGSVFSSPYVPAGTTVAAVATNGLSLTLSSATGVLAGTGPATIFAQNWCATALGTLTLSGTTTVAAPVVTDGFTTQSPWRYVMVIASNLTGTGVTANAWMGV